MFSPRKQSFPALNGADHREMACGQIQIILGPMFSGKTTELIRRCRRYELANYQCVVVKYARDVRYSQDQLATHDRQTLKAISATKLEDVKEELSKHDVIAIDEGQFFPDISLAEELANQQRIVIIAALDGDFRRESFSNVIHLIPKAESVVKLSAVCMRCHRDAAYTKRTSDDTAIEVIGGADKYESVCRRCHAIAKSPLKPPKDIAETENQLAEGNSLSDSDDKNVAAKMAKNRANKNLFTKRQRSPMKQHSSNVYY